MHWRDMTHITIEDAEAEPLEERLFYEPLTGIHKWGYVYLMRMLDSQHQYTTNGFLGCSYKIGKSKNPPARHAAIGVKAPYPIQLLCTIEVRDMDRTERYLHRKLRACHMRGEWFALSEEHVQWFFLLNSKADGETWPGCVDEQSERQSDMWLAYYQEAIAERLFPYQGHDTLKLKA